MFIEGSRAAERYLLVDDIEKREMLQKLLSNMTIENGNVVEIEYKSPYQHLALAPKNADFSTLLRALDEVRTVLLAGKSEFAYKIGVVDLLVAG